MKKFDYKWVMVIVCTLMVLTGLGFCNSAKSLFVGPVSSALEVKRSVYALTDTIRYLATSAASLYFGKLILKFGTKKLTVAGMLFVAISCVIYGVAPNAPLFFTGSVFLGVGLAFSTTSMVGYVMNQWFDKGKGTVTGIALAASGIGGAIATQILTPMIFREGDAFAYRSAYLLCGCVSVAGLIAVLIFFREKGGKVETVKKKSTKNQWEGLEFASVIKKPYFYFAITFVFLSGVALQGMSGSAATHIKDVGIEASYVANVLSVHLFTLAFSKVFTGFIYDKFGLRTTVSVGSLAGIAVMIMLYFVTDSPSGRVLAMIYGVLSAAALPMETVLIPLYASDMFGQRSFAKVMGVFSAVNTAGFALGAPIINSFYDAYNSYKYGFLLFAGVMVVVFVGLHTVIFIAHKERARTEAEKQSETV